MKLAKIQLVFTVFILSHVSLLAQVSNYSFRSYQTIFTALPSNSQEITDFSEGNKIPIGFSFRYGGIQTNYLWASKNGYVLLHDRDISWVGSLYDYYKIGVFIGLLGFDTGGGVSYNTVGSAPNRLLTVQWSKMKWEHLASSASISFQLKIYEGSNKIEFIYKPENGAPSIYAEAEIGLSTNIDYLAVSKLDTSALAFTNRIPDIALKPPFSMGFEFSAPTCQSPVISDTLITNCSAEFYYQTNIGNNLPIEYKLKNHIYQTGVSSKWTNVGANGNKIILDSLSAAAQYYLESRFVCATGDTSAWQRTSCHTSLSEPIKTNFSKFNGNNLSYAARGFDEALRRNGMRQKSYWKNASSVQLDHFNLSGAARMDMQYSFDGSWILTPSSILDSSSFLNFDMALTTPLGIGASTLKQTHYLDVMISTDDGIEWKLLKRVSFADNISNNLTPISVDLKGYSNRIAVFALKVSTGTGASPYDLLVSNLSVSNVGITDIQAFSLFEKIDRCNKRLKNYWVAIKNVGSKTLYQNTDSVSIFIKEKNGYEISIRKKLALPKDFKQGDTIHLYVGSFELLKEKPYSFEVTIDNNYDVNLENNTLLQGTGNLGLISKGDTVKFLNYYGEIERSYSLWQEGTGASNFTPGISSWTQMNSQSRSFLNTTGGASIMLRGNFDDWLVTDEFLIEAKDSIYFLAAGGHPFGVSFPQPNLNMALTDTVFLKVSIDCGSTWGILRTFTTRDSLKYSLENFSVNLDQYKNQKIRFAFHSKSRSIDWFTFFIDKIVVGSAIQNDLKMLKTDLSSKDCFASISVLEVELVNNGQDTIFFNTDSVRVQSKVETQEIIEFDTLISGGTRLLPNDTMKLELGNVNTESSNYIAVSSRLSWSKDVNPYNNSDGVTQFNLNRNYSAGDTIDFIGYQGNNIETLYPGWEEADFGLQNVRNTSWVQLSNLNRQHYGIAGGAMCPFYRDQRYWLISSPIEVSNSDSISYDFALSTSWFDTTKAFIDANDRANVLIQVCGGNWQLLKSYSSSDSIPNIMQSASFDLSKYMGKSIRIAFEIASESGNSVAGFFILNNVIIGKRSSVDISCKGLPNFDCNTEFKSQVLLKNEGNQTIHFISDTAIVQMHVQGDSGQFFEVQVTRDSLVRGDSLWVDFSNFKPKPFVDYLIKTSVFVSGDKVTHNNTNEIELTTEITVVHPPYETDFSGYNGVSFKKNDLGWKLGVGDTVPKGLTSEWSKANPAQTKSLNWKHGIKLNFIDTLTNDWIISPQFNIDTGDVLAFDLAIKTYGKVSDTQMGYLDSLKVLFSDDCGFSWQYLNSILISNQPLKNQHRYSFSLHKQIGNNIRIAFVGVSNTLGSDYDVLISNFEINKTSEVNLAISTPLISNKCPGGITAMDVIITNVGSKVVDFTSTPLKIGYTLDGPLSVDTIFNYSGGRRLNPGDTMFIKLPEMNVSKSGFYLLQSFLTSPNDSDLVNDSSTVIRLSMDEVRSVPQYVDFKYYQGIAIEQAYIGWEMDFEFGHSDTTKYRWRYGNNTFGKAHFATYYVDYNEKHRQVLYSPKLSLSAGDSLTFSFAQNGQNLYNDSFNVFISIDCDSTWELLTSITRADTLPVGSFKEFKIPLTKYYNENARIAFRVKADKTSSSGKSLAFYLTDIFIGNSAKADVAVDSIYVPEQMCYDTIQTVYAVLRNNSLSPLNLNGKALKLKLESNSPITNIDSTIYNLSRVIAASDTFHLKVGKLVTSKSAVYNVEVNAYLDGDVYQTNDSIVSDIVDVEELYPNPQFTNFKGFKDTNLHVVKPGWKEAVRGIRGSKPAYLNYSWKGVRIDNVFRQPNDNPYQIKYGAVIESVSSPHQAGSTYGSIVTPRVKVEKGDSLKFIAGIASLSSGWRGWSLNDYFAVYSSLDCGKTWQLFHVIYSSINSHSLGYMATKRSFSLDQYSGQEIKFAFIVSIRNNINGQIYLSKIGIGNRVRRDVSVEEVIPPQTNCIGNGAIVQANICNNTDTASGNFKLKFKMTGDLVDSNTLFINNLAGNTCITVDVDTLLPATGGLVNFSVECELPDDQLPYNDMESLSEFLLLESFQSPSVINDTVCQGDTAVLIAKSNRTANWYSSQSSGVPFAKGDTLRQFVNNTETFYARTGKSYHSTVGLTDTALTLPVYNPLLNFGAMNFKTFADVILDSITIFPNDTGEINIRVIQRQSIVSNLKIKINKAEKQQVYLGFQLPKNDDYRIVFLNEPNSNVNLISSTNGFQYPMHDSTKAFHITGALNGTDYNWFYNMKLTIGNCLSGGAGAIAHVRNSIELGDNSNYCKDSLFKKRLDAKSAGAQYKWNTGSTDSVLEATTFGNYIVTVTWPGTGCSFVDSLRINHFPLTKVSINNTDTLCSNDSSLELNSGRPIGGNYSGQFVVNDSFLVHVSGIGKHKVLYNYLDVNSCFGSDSTEVVVVQQPVFSLGPDTTICLGKTLVLDSKVSNMNYLWSNGSTKQSISIVNTGNYSLRVQNQSLISCFSSDTISVIVKKCITGIESSEKEKLFTVFPNPTKGLFSVLLNTEYLNTLEVELFSVNGSLVKSLSINYSGLEVMIDIRDLPNGTYMIKVSSEEQILGVTRITKQ